MNSNNKLLQRTGNLLDEVLAKFDFDVMSGNDAVESLAMSAKMRRRLEAFESRLALRIADTNAHVSSGHRDAADKVADVTKSSKADAKKKIDTAKKLVDLPEAQKAFDDGDLSSEQAEAIAGAASNPTEERDLLDSAEKESLAVLQERAKRLKADRSRQAEADDDARKRALRKCWVGKQRDDGMVPYGGLLLPEEAARLRERLDRNRDRIFKDKHKRGITHSFETNMADAFMEIVDGAGVDASAGGSNKKRNVDATVVIDYQALKRGYREPCEVVEIPGCGTVSVNTALDLLGDAMFRVIVADGVDVKTVTSKTRWWNSSVRAALEYRDQRCSMPFCDYVFRLEKDHEERFSEGGPTNLKNGRHLCPHHHGLVTNDGFRLVGEPGNWRWLAPGEMDFAAAG